MALRLGGPVHEPYEDPESWAAAVRRAGFAATVCPIGLDADPETVRAYRDAAERHDILIAEVGAWSNPISPDPATRTAALEKCRAALDLADRLGAQCAVTIAGSRAFQWDGPHPDNLTEETFDLIVETVRGILDDVRPTQTLFCLETMPWVWPDSPDAYLRLVEAIDRPAFGVHLDPVNMMSSPRRALNPTAFLHECFEKLGSRVVNIHAKDFRVGTGLTFHVDECRPGLGSLDYGTFLKLADALPQRPSFVLEHLPNAEEYAAAAQFVRAKAAEVGVELRPLVAS